MHQDVYLFFLTLLKKNQDDSSGKNTFTAFRNGPKILPYLIKKDCIEKKRPMPLHDSSVLRRVTLGIS